MDSEHVQEVRRDLAALRRRLVQGEIDEDTYQRQRELILEDLTTEEQSALGTGAPSPTGGSRFGPSGAAGSGIRTAIPTLADLRLEPDTILFRQWRIVRELGRGGFGVVFEADELLLGQRQAIKVLDPTMVAREELLGRFRREVALMRQLVHPRIVRVYDYREDLEQAQALISMELIAGGPVKELGKLARQAGEPVPLALILEIASQMLEALGVAHLQGIVHRDISPGNVLLAGAARPRELLDDPDLDPRIKLVDFGIAALLQRTELSQKSQVLGTAAYVAPEILDPSAGEQGPPADVYGVGAVIYELLTGELPLGRFDVPSALRPDMPPEAEQLILAMLDRRPENRPPAAAALEEFRRIAERLAHPPTMESGEPESEVETEVAPVEAVSEGGVGEGGVGEEPVSEEPPDANEITKPVPPPPISAPPVWMTPEPPRASPRFPVWLIGAAAFLVLLLVVVLWPGGGEPEPTSYTGTDLEVLEEDAEPWPQESKDAEDTQEETYTPPRETYPRDPAPTPREQAPRERVIEVPSGALGPIHVGGDVVAPVKLYTPPPSYTEEARKARIQGVVIVQATIDVKGNVTRIKVLKSLPMNLDQQAVEAIRQWTFKPATFHGKPVAVYYNLTVNFRLE